MANCEAAVRLRDLNRSDVWGDFVLRTFTRTVLPRELGQVAQKAHPDVFVLAENAELAEISVTEGIDAIDIEDLAEALPGCAAGIPLQLQRANWEPPAANANKVTVELPAELDCVLQLPSPLRHCFGPRLLTGLSLAACADILQLASGSICAGTGAAALEFARGAGPTSALSGW